MSDLQFCQELDNLLHDVKLLHPDRLHASGLFRKLRIPWQLLPDFRYIPFVSHTYLVKDVRIFRQ